jgi:hypothetical protein
MARAAQKPNPQTPLLAHAKMAMITFRRVFLIVILSLQVSAAPYAVTNMGPDFKNYIRQFRNSDFSDQWIGWKAFEKKYQYYFDEIICDSAEASCEDAKKRHLQNFFQQLPTFENSMWKIFDGAEAMSSVQVGRFRRAFPDVKSGTQVVFMPSLLLFNGMGGQKLNGHFALIIGADLAALRQNNMDVVFSHEFFHAYHFEKISGAPIYQTMASPLWFEGLATWVSFYLNPKASTSDILMNPELSAYYDSPVNVASMAKSYDSFLRESYEDEKSTLLKTEWFLGNGKILPHRRGYCLGFKVISELKRNYSVEELTAMGEVQYTNLMDVELQKIAATTGLAADISPPFVCARTSKINFLRPKF